MKGRARKRVGTRGVSWQITIELPRDPLTDGRRQKLLTAPTKNEVEALATQYAARINSGGFAEAETGKLTVSQYLTRWLDSIGQTVRPITQSRYSDLMRNHVMPVVGNKRLARLSPLDVQHLYSDRLAYGLSPTTVEMLHNVLHRALKQAIRWGLLTRNVTEAVDVPRPETPRYST